MTAHHNDWDTSAQRSESSSSITSSSDTEIAALKAEMAEINKNLIRPSLAKPRTYMVREPIKFIKMNTALSLGSKTLPGNKITNPKEELKGITTRSGTVYQGPTIPTIYSSLPQVVERETKATKDTVHPANNESTKDVQPSVVQTESPILNSEPVVNPIIEPVAAPVIALKPNQSPSIPYPSRLHDHKLHDKANDQRENFFQIFKDLNFNISFADALILMPKFGLTIKTLLTNKDKLSELARNPLNEHCLMVLLKKLLEKLGDPDKVAEDVFVKVGTFHFPADFVVVDFNADPRVPLILGRSFLKTGRDLIDVFKGELTLQYSQEVLGFSDVIASGNPTPYYDPIVSTTSPTLTPFRESDFPLEEVNAFLALEDDPTLLEVDQSEVDTEGDILLLEELKIYEAKTDKSLIDEPPEVKLKDLPPHLDYVFLEGDDKLPVIIAKDLGIEEKTALIMVLKSNKRAIAWKLSDIKGIDPAFCTHKILMEDDFEPAEKSHFMVKEGIVLGHKISKNGIEVDKAKVEIIAKLPHPITVKGNVVPTEKQIFQGCEALLLGRPLSFKNLCESNHLKVYTRLGSH
nr:hypothetical protein [Tanacetum cinerariifolium]